MSYDRYQAADTVSANSEQPYHNKGILVIGQGTAAVYPRTADYTSGVTGQANFGTSGDRIDVKGSSTGVFFPLNVAYVGTITAGTTVYRLH